MSFLSAHPDSPDGHGPPGTLDDAAGRIAACGALQAVVALQAALDVLADDLLARRSHVEEPGRERDELYALCEAVAHNRERMASGHGRATARHVVAGIWTWHSGALTWAELVALIVERIETDLGRLVGSHVHVIEIDADDVDMTSAFESLLAAISPAHADRMAADAAAFLVRWWHRLEQRLPFRRATTAELLLEYN
ncbi:MAG: hypothetical protein AB7K09_08960 [Planctomycetota bacterium]